MQFDCATVHVHPRLCTLFFWHFQLKFEQTLLSNLKYFAREWQVCGLKSNLLSFLLCVCVRTCISVCVSADQKKKGGWGGDKTPLLWIMTIHYPLMNGGIYVNHFWHLMGEKLGNNWRQSEQSGAPQWPCRLLSLDHQSTSKPSRPSAYLAAAGPLSQRPQSANLVMTFVVLNSTPNWFLFFLFFLFLQVGGAECELGQILDSGPWLSIGSWGGKRKMFGFVTDIVQLVEFLRSLWFASPEACLEFQYQNLYFSLNMCNTIRVSQNWFCYRMMLVFACRSSIFTLQPRSCLKSNKSSWTQTLKTRTT